MIKNAESRIMADNRIVRLFTCNILLKYKPGLFQSYRLDKKAIATKNKVAGSKTFLDLRKPRKRVIIPVIESTSIGYIISIDHYQFTTVGHEL
ncbi:hypothetical protein GCM10027442_08310 [Emticicia fontis]